MSLSLLITTDFHAANKVLEHFDYYLAEHRPDAVIMAGDLINPDPRELGYVDRYLDLVLETHRLPLFGLHGNNEPEAAWRKYRERGINIHLENRQLGEYTICGIGGLGFMNEAGFEDLSIQDLIINEKTIFVTHVPPRTMMPQPKGPLVHIYGHRHTLAFSKQIGPTLHVQCPAGILGKITLLELPSKAVGFIEI